MERLDGKTLYIFIDEAGNFDFSPTGTKFFVLTAITTVQPLKSRGCFFKLRYELLKDGFNQECFHATEDRQHVRDLVFSHIKELDDFEIDCVVAQKNKTNPSLYIEYDILQKRDGRGIIFKSKHSEEKFYRLISQTLLRYIFNRYYDLSSIEKIVVVLGSIFTSNKREYILKSLKQYLKPKFKKPFYVYFHKAEADINCQLADYCGWALYANIEEGENRPLQNLKGKIKSDFDIFERGTTEYYEYKK